MYEKLSQKIKSYVKVLTIIGMALSMIGGIIAAVLLIRTGSDNSILLGLGAIVAAAVIAFFLYYFSFFAYGFGELLEQQTLQINLDRQILNALRDQTAVERKVPKPAAPQPPQPMHTGMPLPPYPPYPAQKPGYPPYPPYPGQPAEPYRAPKTPYGQYAPPQPQNYRTQTPYGTATGFNEDFHYEPKR